MNTFSYLQRTVLLWVGSIQSSIFVTCTMQGSVIHSIAFYCRCVLFIILCVFSSITPIVQKQDYRVQHDSKSIYLCDALMILSSSLSNMEVGDPPDSLVRPSTHTRSPATSISPTGVLRRVKASSAHPDISSPSSNGTYPVWPSLSSFSVFSSFCRTTPLNRFTFSTTLDVPFAVGLSALSELGEELLSLDPRTDFCVGFRFGEVAFALSRLSLVFFGDVRLMAVLLLLPFACELCDRCKLLDREKEIWRTSILQFCFKESLHNIFTFFQNCTIS